MNDKINRNAAMASELKDLANKMNEDAIRKSVLGDEVAKIGNIIVSKESMDSLLARAIFFEDISGRYKHQVMLDTLHLTKTFVVLETLLGKNYRKSKKVFPAFFEYNPLKKEIFGTNDEGCTILNIFEPPSWRKREYYFQEKQTFENEMPSIYQELINHLTEGKYESGKKIVNWMAYSLMGKNPTYLVLVGGKGVGKTALADFVFKYLHGVQNYMTMTNDTFKGQFNGEIDDHTFGYLDELFIQRNAREQMSKLKLVSNDTIRVEKKHGHAYMTKNHLNLYISSNDYEGIPLEGENRRLFIPFCTDKKLKDTNLIHRLDELKDEKNISKLGRYLLGLAPTFEDVRDPYVCPIVEEKIQDASEKEWEAWAKKWFETSLPKYAVAGEVRFEKFQEDFKKENPTSTISPPGKNRVERFLNDRKSLGWELKKYPTNVEKGITGYRAFVKNPYSHYWK